MLLEVIETICWAALAVINVLAFILDGHDPAKMVLAILFFVLTVIQIVKIVIDTKRGGPK